MVALSGGVLCVGCRRVSVVARPARMGLPPSRHAQKMSVCKPVAACARAPERAAAQRMRVEVRFMVGDGRGPWLQLCKRRGTQTRTVKHQGQNRVTGDFGRTRGTRGRHSDAAPIWALIMFEGTRRGMDVFWAVGQRQWHIARLKVPGPDAKVRGGIVSLQSWRPIERSSRREQVHPIGQ
jgi:hypothetical protein